MYGTVVHPMGCGAESRRKADGSPQLSRAYISSTLGSAVGICRRSSPASNGINIHSVEDVTQGPVSLVKQRPGQVTDVICRLIRG